MLNKFSIAIFFCLSLTFSSYEPIANTIYGKSIKSLDNKSGFSLKYNMFNNPIFKSESTPYLFAYNISYLTSTSILNYYSKIKKLFVDIEFSYINKDTISCMMPLGIDIGLVFNLADKGGWRFFSPYLSMGFGYRGPALNGKSLDLTKRLGYDFSSVNVTDSSIYNPDFYYRVKFGIEIYLFSDSFAIRLGANAFPSQFHNKFSNSSSLAVLLGVEIGLSFYPFMAEDEND